MKRLILIAVSALVLLGNTGCLHHFTQRNNRHTVHHGHGAPHGHSASCGCGSHGRLGGHGLLGGQGLLGGAVHAAGAHHAAHQQAMAGPAGPPAATVAYPYYTLRGPRDFLVDNPPSLGN